LMWMVSNNISFLLNIEKNCFAFILVTLIDFFKYQKKDYFSE
jgi:hypothetical protein